MSAPGGFSGHFSSHSEINRPENAFLMPNPLPTVTFVRGSGTDASRRQNDPCGPAYDRVKELTARSKPR